MKDVQLEKFNSLVQEKLGEVIAREVEFTEMVFVSISRVMSTSDFRLARVYFSCFPEDKGKEAIKQIYKYKKILREELAKSSGLKRVPNLSFYIDEDELAGEENNREVADLLRG